ncbi:DUF3859 domain-containing protein [Yoonia sp. 208BN28-4]|uniref:DUF3859 domain-containing protein n=1 Tax=Yoonia sp. 208BN28-4 TaxID=3126505 RepID=UPI0030A52983
MKHIALLVALALPFAANAQTGPQPDKISPAMASVETGVICAPPATGEVEAPGTVAGTTHLIADEPPFVSTARRVPAVLGIGFGIKSQSIDSGGISDVVMRITHPPMGDAGVTAQTFTSSISGIDPSLTFYQFDFDYELLPGIWQMEASSNGTVLYRTTFEVVTPDQIPELASICGFEELLS